MLFRNVLILTMIWFISACTNDEIVEQNYIEPICINSQSSCVKNTVFGSINIRYNLQDIITETPFKVYISGEQLKKGVKVKGYLEGKEMYMGKIPLLFSLHENNQFIADGLLGSCADEKMKWRMWITIEESENLEIDNKRKAIFFIDFDSKRL